MVVPSNFCIIQLSLSETTDVNFHDRRLKQFLADHGVLNQGFWRWEYFEDEMPAFGKSENLLILLNSISKCDFVNPF